MSQPVPIRPRKLVAHARELANHRSGSSPKPLPTYLRRSASAGYYAVFHGVALAVAAQVGSGLSPIDRARLTRSVDHGRIADVCKWIAKGNDSREHVRPIVLDLRSDLAVRDLADIFLQLQQARHQADYDHFGEFDKASVLRLVDQAERALDLLDGFAESENGRRFLVLIGLHTQLR